MGGGCLSDAIMYALPKKNFCSVELENSVAYPIFPQYFSYTWTYNVILYIKPFKNKIMKNLNFNDKK